MDNHPPLKKPWEFKLKTNTTFPITVLRVYRPIILPMSHQELQWICALQLRYYTKTTKQVNKDKSWPILEWCLWKFRTKRLSKRTKHKIQFMNKNIFRQPVPQWEVKWRYKNNHHLKQLFKSNKWFRSHLNDQVSPLKLHVSLEWTATSQSSQKQLKSQLLLKIMKISVKVWRLLRLLEQFSRFQTIHKKLSQRKK